MVRASDSAASGAGIGSRLLAKELSPEEVTPSSSQWHRTPTLGSVIATISGVSRSAGTKECKCGNKRALGDTGQYR